MEYVENMDRKFIAVGATKASLAQITNSYKSYLAYRAKRHRRKRDRSSLFLQVVKHSEISI